MKRLHISSVIVIGAVATLFAASAPAAPSDTPPAAPSKEFACGAKDNKCPLQAWMNTNMGPSVTGDDPPWKALETNLKLIAGKSPGGGYPNWAKAANDGAAAAVKKDIAGVKASCKTCHDAYKKKFKDENRDMPFP